MLTDAEFLELVEAITKPVSMDQLKCMSAIEASRYNSTEALRAGKALLEFYKMKRGE